LRPFTRFDSYKSHIQAHAEYAPNARIRYVPAAVSRLRELTDKTRQRKLKMKNTATISAEADEH